MSLKIIAEYIDKLKNDSFEGWHPEAVAGYKTALSSLSVFIGGLPAEDEMLAMLKRIAEARRIGNDLPILEIEQLIKQSTGI